MNDRAAQLASSFARAQQLTKVVASPEFDKYAKSLNDGGFIDNSIVNENYRPTEMLPYNPNSMPMQTGGSNYNAEAEMQRIRQGSIQPARNNIGLPKQILDEIKNNPLNGLSSDPTMDAFASQLASVTNLMPPPTTPQQPQRKPTLTEQFTQSQPIQQPMQMTNSSFDYETMKMIIEGVVKKYIEPLKENLLSESVNKDSSTSLKMMKLGKNFQFMDSSGNIYEATMVFKGNIKDKKNKKPAN